MVIKYILGEPLGQQQQQMNCETKKDRPRIRLHLTLRREFWIGRFWMGKSVRIRSFFPLSYDAIDEYIDILCKCERVLVCVLVITIQNEAKKEKKNPSFMLQKFFRLLEII